MPALPAGRVTVQVSNNGADASLAGSEGEAVVELVREARLVSISPSFGPVRGGTEVVVSVLLRGGWRVSELRWGRYWACAGHGACGGGACGCVCVV